MGKLALAQIADGCWELKGKINVEIVTSLCCFRVSQLKVRL